MFSKTMSPGDRYQTKNYMKISPHLLDQFNSGRSVKTEADMMSSSKSLKSIQRKHLEQLNILPHKKSPAQSPFIKKYHDPESKYSSPQTTSHNSKVNSRYKEIDTSISFIQPVRLTDMLSNLEDSVLLELPEESLLDPSPSQAKSKRLKSQFELLSQSCKNPFNLMEQRLHEDQALMINLASQLSVLKRYQFQLQKDLKEKVQQTVPVKLIELTQNLIEKQTELQQQKEALKNTEDICTDKLNEEIGKLKDLKVLYIQSKEVLENDIAKIKDESSVYRTLIEIHQRQEFDEIEDQLRQANQIIEEKLTKLRRGDKIARIKQLRRRISELNNMDKQIRLIFDTILN